MIALVAIAGCDGADESAPPTLEPGRAEQVVIQVGDYFFGWNVDRFVLGPSLTIRADGTAHVQRRVPNDTVTQQTRLSLADVDRLIELGSRLPAPGRVGTLPEDGVANVLVVDGRRWEIWLDPPTAFEEYLAEVDAALDRAGLEPWTPAAWVERGFDDTECTVRASPTVEPWYRTAVFPADAARFPLGELACSGGS